MGIAAGQEPLRAVFTARLPAEASWPRRGALIKLPAGSIRPEGWLRTQLELMASGFTGHLTELSKYCKFEGNAWVDPNGEGANGWEEVPYWLRGYIDLGYVLEDQRIIPESRRWIEGVIKSQREDGYFGPRANLTIAGPRNTKMIDLWPNMVMLYALRTYYEATGDRRAIDLMTRYFKWQASLPTDQFLPASWQKIRGGENLDSIVWLASRTGDSSLLDLARRNHDRTADWTNTVASWHGVNLTECFREPAQFYQASGDTALLAATERNYDTAMREYGQAPGGMFGADENARPGYNGPRQAAETCSMVEFMHSDEMLAGITGDPVWLDRAEDVAFNSLPAAMTPDLKGLHYLTAPNQVQLDRANKAPMIRTMATSSPTTPTNTAAASTTPPSAGPITPTAYGWRRRRADWPRRCTLLPRLRRKWRTEPAKWRLPKTPLTRSTATSGSLSRPRNPSGSPWSCAFPAGVARRRSR